MSLKSYVIRRVVRWIWHNHRYLVMDECIGPERHIAYNPGKKPKGE